MQVISIAQDMIGERKKKNSQGFYSWRPERSLESRRTSSSRRRCRERSSSFHTASATAAPGAARRGPAPQKRRPRRQTAAWPYAARPTRGRSTAATWAPGASTGRGRRRAEPKIGSGSRTVRQRWAARSFRVRVARRTRAVTIARKWARKLRSRTTILLDTRSERTQTGGLKKGWNANTHTTKHQSIY